jgi:hypothetical protein
MSANHLIIGLGGTGAKIIRSFRKTIFQEFRKENPDGANLAYLYVDSSSELMSIDDPSWKILGTSVQLNKKSQLLIQDANLATRLENINNYPGIKPWIGNTDQWKDILGTIIGETLGGQKRRLGRFLFSCKVDKFKQQVQSLIRDLQATGTADTTFHICCGLAGGTGSGSLIDAISQIRDTYPDSRRYRIIVYALLPETYPNPNWDTGNYHANGYAALLELNALSVGRFEPTDLTGIKDRLKLMDPFNGCYLFTNENENGLTVDVDIELPNIVADFLYHKIIAVRNVSWPTLGRMENAENGDGTAEKAAGTNNPERSKRFLTFGIKRLAIPEQEISEYLTYNFARQAALQLRFNNWSDTNGFNDEAKNQDFNEFVKQKETQYKWALSDDHLALSVGILPEDVSNKKWKPINNEWQDVIPNFKSLVREKRRETWLDELAKLCEKRFDQDYRGLGVRNFYKAKLKAKKEHVKEIRRRIEEDIFNEWKNGVKSTYDISRLLAAVLDATEERLKGLDDRITQVKDNEEKAANEVKVNNEDWARMGFFGKNVFGKPDSLLDTQGEALLEQYTYRTRKEALAFSKQLIEELIVEITDLKGEVDKCTSIISEAIKKYNDRIAERITDDGSIDLREQLVRFYSPELVRTITKNLIKDENEQRTQTNRVRMSLIGRLGENPNFALFNQRIGVPALVDVLDDECARNARIAHNNLVQNPKEKLLGVSIIERLKERYAGGSQELKSYVTELVSRAGNYISFEASEVGKKSSGIATGAQTAVSMMSVIMPKAPEEAEFVSRLKGVFQGSRSGEVEIIDSDVRPNEIVLVSLTNLFPLRYVRQLGFLKQKYDLKINGSNAQRAKLELHLEGDGSQHPKLFVLSKGEGDDAAIPYLLLAKSLGLIQQAPNPKTGATEMLLVAKDEDGFDTVPIYLGKSFIESTDKLNEGDADLIREYVRVLLQTREYSLEAKRLEIQKAVVADVENIKVERGNNIQDEVYKRFLEGGKTAVKILKRED